MDEDWRRLLAEQTADIAQIKKEVHRVYKYIRGQRLLGYIKIAIIILTIVAGVVYLPPLIRNLVSQLSPLISK
ncbi:hypothetical protein KBI31_00970 [Patescibacteria group bacterium]|jgi:cytochrome b subunit of formate dehydrogenase|nr:hypothetical protein [Patescibacteria group bacterium]HPD07668.1 hypothetical protein [bacterium]HRT10983.1 hypothetical protein [Patescibacteria group bacterium]HRU89834.1 hypothetical protein [Patescibacteria group bacterium]